MSEKLEVRGDVGQLIGGNVNEAPRQNNVVNFNVGSDKGPVQTLTDLQRKRIAGLVRDLCSITQEDTLDVYRVILTEFGAERMRDMPREKYHNVVAQIERWIFENKHSDCHKLSSVVSEMTAPILEQPVGTPSRQCNRCAEKEIGYMRLQRVSRGQWALSAILAATCALLLYKMPAASVLPPISENHCFYDGKPYSAGSAIKLAGSLVSICTAGDLGKMTWIQTK